jgi:CHAD domain-containing protein
MSRMPGAPEYEELRRRMARRFRAGQRAIAELTPRVHLHLEPTAVHDLRVATRRLRALIWVARRVGPHSACKRLRKILRAWGQALGERRMLDVVLEKAAQLNMDASALAERHGHAADAVRMAVTAEGAAEASALLGRTALKVREWSEHRLHQGLILCAKELHKALRDAPKGKADQHQLRIEAKKARYVLEAVGCKCEPLKELQGLLGDSHDMEILQQLLGPHPGAAEIEARQREAALRIMKDAVHAAEAELKTVASALRESRIWK